LIAGETSDQAPKSKSSQGKRNALRWIDNPHPQIDRERDRLLIGGEEFDL
jgi:hypothetical protein